MPKADKAWITLLQMRLGPQVLGPAERDAVARAYQRTRIYRRGQNIDDYNDRQSLHLVTSGWAARVSMLDDGSQQITDFVLPGEFCDLAQIAKGRPGRAVALTPLRAALLDQTEMLNALETHPKLGLAMLRLAFSEQAILREWLVCLGRREKRAHLAHLLCELRERLRRAGMASEEEFDMPLTQAQLADAMGMTPIHTNRVLQQLRKELLITLDQRHLRIHELRQLKDIGEFDGGYLAT